MTDPTPDAPRGQRGMSPEVFARFLQALAPDEAEAGRRYTRLHRKLAGFFQLRGVSDPGDAADDTIDRAALRIHAGAPVPDVTKYCLGIARNVALERWRREQKEELVSEDYVAALARHDDGEIERIRLVLKPCLEQLADAERELLMAYCHVARGRARAEYRRRLAESRQTTVLALRMRVTRLRSILTDCVQKRSAPLA
jgi:hypothetical protein